MRYRRYYGGANHEIASQPGLPMAENPVLDQSRRPDALLLRQGEEAGRRRGVLNEVKAGSGKLDPERDIQQIEDGLKAVAQQFDRTTGRPAGALGSFGAGAEKQAYQATEYMLTVMNKEKVLSSETRVMGWFKEYKRNFVLEVFDSKGRPHQLRYKDLAGRSLSEVLRDL